MVQAMAQMAYDAYNLGVRELAYGQDFIKTQTEQWKVPLLCANLIRAKDGKPFATPYLIKDVGGIRVAVLGLMSGLFYAHKYRPEDEELRVQDPVEVASQLVPLLRNQAEVVVVLGHITMEEAEALADRIPGIQAIILAWAMGIIDPPVEIKKTLILSAGTKGSHLGELYLHLNWEKRVISQYSRITPLGGKIPEDPEIRELIASYGLAPPAEEPPSQGGLPKI